MMNMNGSTDSRKPEDETVARLLLSLGHSDTTTTTTSTAKRARSDEDVPSPSAQGPLLFSLLLPTQRKNSFPSHTRHSCQDSPSRQYQSRYPLHPQHAQRGHFNLDFCRDAAWVAHLVHQPRHFNALRCGHSCHSCSSVHPAGRGGVARHVRQYP